MYKAKESILAGIEILELQIREHEAMIKTMKVGEPDYDETVGRCALMKVACSKAIAAIEWIERI